MGNNLIFTNNSTLSATDAARLSAIESALPISVAGSVIPSSSGLAVPSSTAVLPSGLISPTTGVANTGNAFPFVVQGNFGFVWSGTVLTIYWDGTNGSIPFVIRRSDGSQISIPKSSMSVSALQGSTKYGFAPFISVAQPQRVSFVTGDSGSPRYAFSPSAPSTLLATAAQTQNLSSNEAITSGFVYFTTGVGGAPASGSGTNSSGNNPYSGQVPTGGGRQEQTV